MAQEVLDGLMGVCSLSSTNPCVFPYECTLTTHFAGTALCACPEGFTGDGLLKGVGCEDIDECALLDNLCGVGGICTNTQGGFECSCLSGFETDPKGFACVDINECTTDPPCTGEGLTCQNTEGGFECLVEDPLSPTGVSRFVSNAAGTMAVDKDECTFNGGADSACLQVCVNDVLDFATDASNTTALGYSCECGDGFTQPTDIDCADIDECALMIDTCEGQCFNTVGSFECECKEEFGLQKTKDGCVELNECLEYPYICGGPDSCCIDLPSNDGKFDCADPIASQDEISQLRKARESLTDDLIGSSSDSTSMGGQGQSLSGASTAPAPSAPTTSNGGSQTMSAASSTNTGASSTGSTTSTGSSGSGSGSTSGTGVQPGDYGTGHDAYLARRQAEYLASIQGRRLAATSASAGKKLAPHVKEHQDKLAAKRRLQILDTLTRTRLNSFSDFKDGRGIINGRSEGDSISGVSDICPAGYLAGFEWKDQNRVASREAFSERWGAAVTPEQRQQILDEFINEGKLPDTIFDEILNSPWVDVLPEPLASFAQLARSFVNSDNVPEDFADVLNTAELVGGLAGLSGLSGLAGLAGIGSAGGYWTRRLEAQSAETVEGAPSDPKLSFAEILNAASKNK